MATETEGPLALTVAEAAKRIGISTQLYYEGVRANEVPFRRIGRRIIVPLPELEAYMGMQQAGMDHATWEAWR